MPAARARARSRLWDYAAIAGWLTFLAAATATSVGAGRPLLKTSTSTSPLKTDVVITALTVVPVLAYLVSCEAGRNAATLGKRRCALTVSGRYAPAPPEGRSSGETP